MLVPSGNDAAYVVADYCGGLLSPQAESCQERVRIFMENLNLHLQQQGYLDTVLYDPSGFDMEALTTTLDLKEVVYRLLEYSWFREIVSQNTYTATLPDGSTQIWQNTNAFLDPTSEYYNENVCGIKTGSLSDDYNLIVLYQQHGKEFLICSLGSQSDSSRYDDVNFYCMCLQNQNREAATNNPVKFGLELIKINILCRLPFCNKRIFTKTVGKDYLSQIFVRPSICELASGMLDNSHLVTDIFGSALNQIKDDDKIFAEIENVTGVKRFCSAEKKIRKARSYNFSDL